ncbi:DUF3566 domain-containing protein [Streptomyces albireticuli]|uniref:DUF3566 domain-containing protein n=1 Tax=Streptomyces albireticuli TaxID=1940 RepID=UPI0036983DC3
MTDTRDPKPYHPPQAYAPPAERSASGSGSTDSNGTKAGEPAEAAGEKTSEKTSEKVTGKAAGKAAGKTPGKASGTTSEKTATPKAAEAGPAEKPAAEADTSGKAGKPGKVDPRRPAPAAQPSGKSTKLDKGAPDAAGAKASTGARSAPAAAQRAAEQPRVPGPRPEPRTAQEAQAAPSAPRTRKARLRVAKVDPWSVMKVSFLLSIAVGVCTIVAAAVLWTVMDAMGVFQAVGGTVSDATTGSEGGGFDLESFLSLPNVLIFTSLIAVIDVVLATALATLGAFVYNLSAGFVGGVELTLAEDE